MISKIKCLFIILIICIAYTKAAYAQADNQIEDVKLDSDSYVYITSSQSDNNMNFNVIEKVDIRKFSYMSCKDVPLLMEKCLPSVCYQDTPFGKNYKQIIGKNSQGNCLYKEVTSGLGGIECEFTKEHLSKIGGLFDKFFFKIGDDNYKFTEEEANSLKNFFNDDCQSIVDIFKEETVKITPNKVTKIASPEKRDEPEEAVVNMDTAYIKKNVEISVRRINNLQSIAFSKSQLEELNLLVNPLTSDKLKGLASSGKLAGSLIFYLNSILFYGKNDWVVWLNNGKYVKNQNYPDIDFLDVTPNEIKVIYIVRDIDKVAPNWRVRLEPIAENIFRSHDNNIKVELLADGSVKIFFTLKPNQSFAINNMLIVEGKIL